MNGKCRFGFTLESRRDSSVKPSRFKREADAMSVASRWRIAGESFLSKFFTTGK